MNTFIIIEPGEVEFAQAVYVVKESVGTFDVAVTRTNGADGKISVDYHTSDINAVSGKDYKPCSETLTFEHNETAKTISIMIMDDKVSLLKPTTSRPRKTIRCSKSNQINHC